MYTDTISKKNFKCVIENIKVRIFILTFYVLIKLQEQFKKALCAYLKVLTAKSAVVKGFSKNVGVARGHTNVVARKYTVGVVGGGVPVGSDSSLKAPFVTEDSL